MQRPNALVSARDDSPPQIKAPIVEVLEERVMEAAEERSAAGAASAAADDIDELRGPEAAVAAALGVLSRGAHCQHGRHSVWLNLSGGIPTDVPGRCSFQGVRVMLMCRWSSPSSAICSCISYSGCGQLWRQ